MSFEAEFEKQRQRLTPLFAEAVDADREFHAVWDEQTTEFGASRYKQTQQYLHLQNRFQVATEAIAPIIDKAIEKFKLGELKYLPTLVAYLDLPGRYYRSGYNRKTIYRLLKQATLDESHLAILRRIILQHILTAGPEFTSAIKLTPIIANDEFIKSVDRFRQSKKAYVVQRAEKILAKLALPE